MDSSPAEPGRPRRARTPRQRAASALLVASLALIVLGAFAYAVPVLPVVCFALGVPALVLGLLLTLAEAAPSSWEEAERTGGLMGSLWRFQMRDAPDRPRGGRPTG